MKALYLDLQSGISGDMFLGALLDLGLEREMWEKALSSLPLFDYQLKITSLSVQKMAATDFQVIIDKTQHQPARHLSDIQKIIEKSKLSSWVKERAVKVFQLLAQAEAKIHSTTPDKVHFHEVGAVDSIIDIVGTLIALEKLEIEKIYASVPHLGCGEVTCEHGILPLPAPAVLEILSEIEVKFIPDIGETVTPTGAALLKALITDWSLPTGKIIKTGYGAGKRQAAKPNLLRAVLLEISQPTPKILVVETNLDDMNPELLPPVMEKLLHQGALDVYLTPIYMKKNRVGVKLSALIKEDDFNWASELMLRETSSFGLRYYPVERVTLLRKIEVIETRWGEVQVKVGYLSGEIIKVTPEFESALALSKQYNIPLLDIYSEINSAKNTLKKS